MRKFLPHIALITIALVGAGLFFVPHVAHAADLLGITTWGTDIMYGLIGKFFWFILVPATGWLLWLVGQMIDAATNVSLAPGFFNSPAINTSWSIIRDMCNMLFIFVLIWAGLRTILNIGNAAAVRKTITGVIIAALFINFSLFIGKAIIDVSNVATAWFVQGVENIGQSQSVSDSIHSVLQMDKLATNKNFGGANSSYTLQAFVTGLALFIINCVAVYVFFNVAFFLIARIVAFIFLLITAPLGFVGWLEVPQLTEYAKNWWKEMRSQALMAPMFFLMLYITLYLVDQIDTLVFGVGAAAGADPTTGSSFAPANYVMFAIIIMMLLKSLKVAKEYSGEFGDSIAGYLKSATMFATGAVATRTLGLAGSAIKSSAYLQRTASGSGIGSVLAKRTLVVGNYAAKSDFGMAGAYKSLAKGTPLAGQFKGAEKGYEGLIDREKKKDVEFAKMLGRGKTGEENRLRYARNLPHTLYNNTIGWVSGATRTGSLNAAEDIQGAAVKAYLTAEKDEPKKKASKAKAELVYAEMRKRAIDSALETKNAGKNDAALQREIKETEMVIGGLQKEVKKMDKTKDVVAKAKERKYIEDNLGKMSATDAAKATERFKTLNKQLEDYDKAMKVIETNTKAVGEMKEGLNKEPATVEKVLENRKAQISDYITATKADFDAANKAAKQKKRELDALTEEDKKGGGGEGGGEKKGGGGEGGEKAK